MSIKISLDAQAVKKLIENGGEQAEIELRNGVIGNLKERFMEIISKEEIKKFELAISEAVQEEFKNVAWVTKKKYSLDRVAELNLTIKNQIRREVDETISIEISKAINELFKKEVELRLENIQNDIHKYLERVIRCVFRDLTIKDVKDVFAKVLELQESSN